MNRTDRDPKLILEQEILPRVERPSRYLGNELHAVHKDLAQVEVRLALVFPDLYDLGLGNLGLQILYSLLNRLPWVWCERANAPAEDMEAALKEHGVALFALESRDPLSAFDGVGFTLQSELTYTNVLNLLAMAEIPLRSADRREADPLVFAGGPTAFNPEPMAPFFDFVVIGEGEEVVIEIAEVFRAVEGRAARLEALSRLEGVYVPALYPMEALEDGTLVPPLDAPRIRRRMVRDLDAVDYPTEAILPWAQLVHDRVGLEVLRGCTHGCRFCQAGMTQRPVRERSADRVVSLLQEAVDQTGHEEVSLVSLSTCDHSQVRELIEKTVDVAKARHVAVSLPSLRLDTFSVELASMAQETRRTGLTLAPEAASPRLRAVINKWIPDEELLRTADEAFAKGWGHLKLYFMIGLPTETDEDVQAIADLAHRALAVGKRRSGRAAIHLGVSTFVPKPHTPLQWARQVGIEETQAKQRVLLDAIGRDRNIKPGRHDPRETFIEGLISRGDRRTADLIEAAWRKGAVADAWRERLNFQAWLDAVEEVGFSVEGALRERALDERFPWDHILTLVDPEWLKEDYRRALALEWAPDCRQGKCNHCGVMEEDRELCLDMLKRSKAGRAAAAAPSERVPVEAGEGVTVARMWVRIEKTGRARFLSHLEAMEAWIRAARRANVPLAWTQGFHPHPRVAFSAALAQGLATRADYMDLRLHAPIEPAELLARLKASLPEDFTAADAWAVPLSAPSLMEIAAGSAWEIRTDEPGVDEKIAALVGSEQLLVQRKRKARRGNAPEVIEVDVRPMLLSLERRGERIHMEIGAEAATARVKEYLALLLDDVDAAHITRVQTLVQHAGGWRDLADYAAELQG
ncbi:MAG: TIGR03960 family B12-binding radical SAM protein [Deltaproteobacteria bacterium]|nr:TIGR03960 family B12-binding radical SAM protein [Deltaproteobacteria bacterium]